MPHTAVRTADALHALLEGTVDYAGLFPPAALSFDRAFRNFLAYRDHPHAWMLARFVAPVSRLDDVARAARAADVSVPVALSALAAPAADATDWRDALRRDLDAVAAAHDAHGTSLRVDGLELKLSTRAWQAGEADALLRRLVDDARAAGLEAVELFAEVPLDPDALAALPEIAGAAARHAGEGVGLKFRLGGATDADHPPSAPVARALVACRDAGAAFKATAGLHHPIRHYNEAAGATMHGFLNLFAAAALAHRHGLDADAVRSVLEERDPEAFAFDDAALRWRDLAMPTADVQAARRDLLRSFGSCSFEEPIDDLRALGRL